MRIVQKKLEELADVIAGQSPPSSTYNSDGRGLPFYQGKADFGKKYPSVRMYCSKPKKVAFKNDILMSVRAPVGAVNICDQQSCIGRGLSAIRAREDVSSEYLYYYLKKNQDRIESLGTGSTFKAITQKTLKEVKISIPDLPEDQIRIATLLSHVEQLIEQRQESLQLLDELVKGVFLEMFGGDVTSNPHGFPETNIGDLAKEVKYGTSQSAKGGSFPYLRMNNITYEGYWDFEKLKYIDVDDDQVHKYVLRPGDLVFNRTNSKELVGKTGVYEGDNEMIIAGYLIRVRFKKTANPWFVWGFLNSHFGKKRLLNLCRNIVGMANINAKELQSIPIIRPPIELQNRFATIVRKVRNDKVIFRKSLESLEKLFDSLSQRAFRGELDLSKIPLPETPAPPSEVDLPMDSATNLVDFTAESLSWLGRGFKTLVTVLLAEKAGTPLSDEAIQKIKEEFDEEHRPKVKAWVENWMGALRGENSFTDLLQNFYLKEDEIFGEEDISYEDVVANLKELLSGKEYAALKQIFNEESGEIKFILNETSPLKA